MKLYRVDSGATYWVVAEDKNQAISLAGTEEALALDDPEELKESMSGVIVKELTEEQAHKSMFLSDETGEQCSMWDEFQQVDKPCVIACSEW